MLDKLNSIWKNLLFDIIVGLIFIGLIIYNLYDKRNNDLDFTTAHKISIGLYLLLGLHGLFLIVLIIKNAIHKNFIKAVVFLLTAIGLFAGLYLITMFLFLSTIGGPPVDDYEYRDFENFRETVQCKAIDTNKLKATIIDLKSGIYLDSLTKSFVKKIQANYEDKSEYYEVGGIDSFPNFLPDTILKVECGCRRTDTTTMVVRIWDIHEKTFLLKLKSKNGQWVYDDLYPLTFY